MYIYYIYTYVYIQSRKQCVLSVITTMTLYMKDTFKKLLG